MSAPTPWQSRRDAALNRRLARAVGRGAIATSGSGGYLFRPGELLVGHGVVDALRGEVGRDRVRPDEQVNARFADRGVDVQRWLVDGDIALPQLHRALIPHAAGVGSHVELNHVLTGEPYYKGGPAAEPVPAAALYAVPPGPRPASAAVAVLDTGVTSPPHALFAASLLAMDPADVDVLDEDGNGVLDTEAGHGTFICGLVDRVAPGVGIEQQKVLDPSGFGDDLTIALGVAETTAPVLNLSLGGYTRDDRPPHALARALRSIGADRVVVAAAGNNGDDRRFWPAAFAGVIAVAAYDSADGTPATFSNHGPWVDVCAPGVDLHSCYVDGWRGPDPAEPEFTGWARWSGTSFAAPLVAAEIGRRVVEHGGTARAAADALLAELGDPPADGYGRRYVPPFDLRAPREDLAV
jgi:subtilisin family serine protease